ncbi:hypothetical protein AM493_14195 [Flavobacterium akiainvivens]|uniref:Fibronectin type-III domain-containing protein n=1 Tax=Flavobacterium akiainvivens TaxID=1202724 RepID=A0A0M8MC49_9FLAO|nr:hypothetical protein [Flavobacterium akiainvivens]KOS07055.1 hypothetical protein AM493_14195 [Flavobacterium akiainvivens]SFQ58698.1 hypothetical protein SAMN05444144_10934 [Flavobacterium akiainvivens]
MKKKILLFSLPLVLTSCGVENIITATPLVTTFEAINIQDTHAEIGGEVYNDAGSRVTENGVVLSTTSALPTVNDIKVVAGTGEGVFYGVYDELQDNTTYYYRAFGTNSNGTGYGEVVTFTTLPSSCSPELDNQIATGTATLTVNDVVKETSWLNYDNGNIQYFTEPLANNTVVTLQFYETHQQPPATGTYSTTQIFKNEDTPSVWKVRILFSTNGQDNSGTLAPDGEFVFVENNNGTITFTFCDTYINSQYSLNGKFTYIP